MKKTLASKIKVLSLSLLIIIMLVLVNGLNLSGIKYYLILAVVVVALFFINFEVWKKDKSEEDSTN